MHTIFSTFFCCFSTFICCFNILYSHINLLGNFSTFFCCFSTFICCLNTILSTFFCCFSISSCTRIFSMVIYHLSSHIYFNGKFFVPCSQIILGHISSTITLMTSWNTFLIPYWYNTRRFHWVKIARCSMKSWFTRLRKVFSFGLVLQRLTVLQTVSRLRGK